jgi:hypothetical protein
MKSKPKYSGLRQAVYGHASVCSPPTGTKIGMSALLSIGRMNAAPWRHYKKLNPLTAAMFAASRVDGDTAEASR